jgi:hypothetical protein
MKYAVALIRVFCIGSVVASLFHRYDPDVPFWYMFMVSTFTCFIIETTIGYYKQ